MARFASLETASRRATWWRVFPKEASDQAWRTPESNCERRFAAGLSSCKLVRARYPGRLKTSSLLNSFVYRINKIAISGFRCEIGAEAITYVVDATAEFGRGEHIEKRAREV
jgi:hypothetical protein